MITLIIPFYNCESLVDETLTKVKEYIEGSDEKIEFIPVDDGSRDNTWEKLKRYECDNIRPISYGDNKGKGGAIREGILHSNGDKIIFTDADLAYGLEPIKDFSKALDNVPIAVGNRRSDLGLAKTYGIFRAVASKVFSLIIEMFLHLGISDTQCGFKGYGKDEAVALFSNISVMGFGFDLEVLSLARKSNMPIETVNITLLKNSENSSVNVFRDGLEMIFQLYKIRKNTKRGVKVDKKDDR